MQHLPPGVHEGALVQARALTWRVAGVRLFTGCALVALEPGDLREASRRTLIAPCDHLTLAAPPRPTRASKADAAHLVRLALATQRPGDGLWTAATSRFDIHAWQLAPALAVLHGATRLLLADAVGLGKTVQAGLVLAELVARGLVNRALVLSPAALREAWASELAIRFGLTVDVMDQARARAFQRHARHRNPWTQAPIVVSSIDLVKRPDVRAAVEDQPLDLLIVDEAHHAAPHTDRGVLVERLARRTPWVVLLSATPHAGDPAALAWRLTLGQVGGAGEPPMRMFRRTPGEVGRVATRVTRVVRVRPSDAEHRLHLAVSAYTRDLCAGPLGREPGVQLLASLLGRRAASSVRAVARTLGRRLRSLDTMSAALETRQPALPWEEHEVDEEGPDPWLGRAALADRTGECLRLRALLTLAEAAAVDASKPRCLGRLLGRVREPVVIFTEFRDTLVDLAAALGAREPLACLHGGMDAGERSRALRRFLDGGARVLLTTDVAGEGLNLQTRARVVVTVEWPWRPHRLEQRLGRVDRLGQTRRVHAVHLTARDTFEEVVAARLRARAEAIADDWTIRAAAAPTDAGAETHTSGAGGDHAVCVADLQRRAQTERARVEHEATRLRHARSMLGRPPIEGKPSGRRADGRGPVWVTPARHASSCRLVVVCVVEAFAPSGNQTRSQVVALAVDLSMPVRHRRHWRRLANAMVRDARLVEAATAAARDASGTADWQSVAHRMRAIGRALDTAPSGGGVQPGLFDRRALRAAEARAEVLTRLRHHVAGAADRLARLDTTTRHDVRVVAMLPLASTEGA